MIVFPRILCNICCSPTLGTRFKSSLDIVPLSQLFLFVVRLSLHPTEGIFNCSFEATELISLSVIVEGVDLLSTKNRNMYSIESETSNQADENVHELPPAPLQALSATGE